MFLACSTASFPLENLPRGIARVSWAGYRAVELALPGGEPERAEGESELAERLAANELRLAAVQAGELGAADAEAALSAAGRIGRAALLAVKLGGERVVATAPAEGSRETLAAGVGQLLDALAEVPVRIAVANRAGSLIASPNEMGDLVRRVDSPRLEIAFDPGEALIAGWRPAPTLVELPATPGYVYLDDARGGHPAPPGMGDVDWPELARALRQAGYDGYLTLRLAGADPWAVEPAAKEARFAALQWFELDDWTG